MKAAENIIAGVLKIGLMIIVVVPMIFFRTLEYLISKK
jgi:hypothetical protein